MLSLVYTLVPWISLILGGLLGREDGQSIWDFFLSSDGVEIGFAGLVLTVIVLVVTFFGAIEEIDNPILLFLAGLGVLADILCLILPYSKQIAAWFEANGKTQAPIYLAILLAVLLLNVMGRRAKKRLGDFKAPFPLLPLGLYLIIPTMISYIYDDMATTRRLKEFEPNLDIMEWEWTIKICFVISILLILKFFLSAIWEKSPLFWMGAAHLGNIVAVSFLYILLERAVFPISTGGILSRILIYIPLILMIPGFFHFYSYLFFLHGVIDFFFPGAIRSWRLAKEAEASESVDEERQAMEEKLDARERMFNALDGQGPFTDAEALGRGSLSTEEYVKRQIAREQKLDKK